MLWELLVRTLRGRDIWSGREYKVPSPCSFCDFGCQFLKKDRPNAAFPKAHQKNRKMRQITSLLRVNSDILELDTQFHEVT